MGQHTCVKHCVDNKVHYESVPETHSLQKGLGWEAKFHSTFGIHLPH